MFVPFCLDIPYKKYKYKKTAKPIFCQHSNVTKTKEARRRSRRVPTPARCHATEPKPASLIFVCK